MTISGAYGADYKSKKEIVDALNAGKDFEVRDLFSGGGRYANLQDLVAAGKTSVTVRYKADRSVTVVQIKDGKAK